MRAATGIYGGTFDPVHIGHLRTALELLTALNLKEIRFIPASQPPHRPAPRAAATLRAQMLESVVREQPGFVLDRRELERAGPSYTVDTLASLRAEKPDRPLALVLGMDAFLGLPGWHEWERLFDLAHLVIVHRPGATMPDSGVLGELLRERRVTDPRRLAQGAGAVMEQAVTALDISASAIRGCVAGGGDPRFLVPDAVRDIILASGCYDESGHAAGRRPGAAGPEDMDSAK